jgi:hypothetical protein
VKAKGSPAPRRHADFAAQQRGRERRRGIDGGVIGYFSDRAFRTNMTSLRCAERRQDCLPNDVQSVPYNISSVTDASLLPGRIVALVFLAYVLCALFVCRLFLSSLVEDNALMRRGLILWRLVMNNEDYQTTFRISGKKNHAADAQGRRAVDSSRFISMARLVLPAKIP